MKIDEETFDAVVSDIGLPGLDGVELLHQLRARGLGIPVVLVSGASDSIRAPRKIEPGEIGNLSAHIARADGPDRP